MLVVRRGTMDAPAGELFVARPVSLSYSHPNRSPVIGIRPALHAGSAITCRFSDGSAASVSAFARTTFTPLKGEALSTFSIPSRLCHASNNDIGISLHPPRGGSHPPSRAPGHPQGAHPDAWSSPASCQAP